MRPKGKDGESISSGTGSGLTKGELQMAVAPESCSKRASSDSTAFSAMTRWLRSRSLPPEDSATGTEAGAGAGAAA